MLKILSSIVLAFSLLSTTANASTVSGLKEAYDEFQYALTVEWDQKDKSFYNEQMRVFGQKMEDLHKSGLTYEEMMNYSKTLIKNEKAAKDFEATLKLISAKKLSPQEAHKYLRSALEKSLSTGASYRGDGMDIAMYVTLGFLALIFVVIAVGGATGSVSGSSSGSSTESGDYSDYDAGYSDGYSDGSSGW